MANVLENGMPLGLALGNDGNYELETSQGGQGAIQAVPQGSANGAALGTMPAGAIGVRLYLASGDSFAMTIASAAPSSPPTNKVTISGSNGPNWDENLSNGEMIYVVGTVTGSPMFRWI